MDNKYISGDFIADYARLMGDLKKAQAELDDSYARSVNKLVAMETSRLEEVLPVPFEPGTIVKTFDGRIGKVLACPVDFSVTTDESYHGESHGPGKYFQLDETNHWEDIVTCEGMLRRVTVEFEASELEKDWGTERVTQCLYPDEIIGVV